MFTKSKVKMNDIQNEIKRLSNLKNYKNFEKSAIEKIARGNIWKKQIKIEDRFSQKEDKEISKNVFDAYLSNYSIESFNDAQNVADLVYEEVMLLKVQKEIDKNLSDESNGYTPTKQIDTLHNIQERIWSLKEKIGISVDKTKNDLTALEELEAKFQIYIAFNRNEFTTVCSDCGTVRLLRRRVKDFDNLKHPFFSGRFYFNRRGIELVKAGIWTKEQYAFAFYTSVEYVNWCLENEHKIVEIDEVEEADIQSFINNNPYLQPIKIPEKILNKNQE